MSGVASRIMRGAVAGAVGTLAMDLVWYRRYRRGGGTDGFADWDFATGASSFAEASAPAHVGQKIAAAAGIQLPERSAATVTNAMHWMTGVGYGAIGHGLLPRSTNPVLGGLAVGAGAYLTSYAALGALGIYEPIWNYNAGTLTRDLTAHLTYGMATSATVRLIPTATGA